MSVRYEPFSISPLASGCGLGHHGGEKVALRTPPWRQEFGRWVVQIDLTDRAIRRMVATGSRCGRRADKASGVGAGTTTTYILSARLGRGLEIEVSIGGRERYRRLYTYLSTFA